MNKASALFLQAVVVLIGVSTLAFLLWEPSVEGVNAHKTLFQIYFQDPFVLGAYALSILFFIALYQSFRVLGYARHNNLFSEATARALRIVRYCTTALMAAVLAAQAYLVIVRPGDDIAGGVFMGLLLVAVFGVFTSVATRFEIRLGKGM